MDNRNIIVGAGNAYLKGSVTAAATGGTANSTTFAPADAAKYSIGDIIAVGDDKVAITAIDEATGVVSHDTVAVPATTGNISQVWRNLGATDGGIELTGGTQVQDHFVDQSVYPVAATVQTGSAGVRIPLAEQTLQNLAAAFGVESSAIATVDGTEVLGIGSTEKIREDQVLITGPGPKGKKRTVLIHRGINKGTVSYRLDKQGKAVSVLDLGAYFDSSKAKGKELMEIKDHATEYQF